MHMCMCIYMYVYVCMYVYMCIEKNEIRERFAKEHGGNPKYFALSHKGPHRKATHKDVASFGEAVENGRCQRSDRSISPRVAFNNLV